MSRMREEFLIMAWMEITLKLNVKKLLEQLAQSQSSGCLELNEEFVSWKVIVSADRGLYANWLYQKIVELGWHPFLRINHQGYYRHRGSSSWQPLATVLTSKNLSWSGQITCFKSNPLNCTLLARWDEGYADPWLIITDLESINADVS